jgi:hypothetical protein
MSLPRYGRIVTDYFLFLERDPREPSKLFLRSGIETLAAILVRSCAHEILVPYVEARIGEPLETTLRKLPRSFAKRIRVVDQNQRIRRQVERYFEPVQQGGSPWPSEFAIDFLYKLTLAAKYESWADISTTYQMEGMLNLLERTLCGEAKARVDQVMGLWNMYDRTESVPPLSQIWISIAFT